MISYHIVSYHIISYHIIPYHIISYHIISYHIISYHIISYDKISFHIVPYHIIPHPLLLSIKHSLTPLSRTNFLPLQCTYDIFLSYDYIYQFRTFSSNWRLMWPDMSFHYTTGKCQLTERESMWAQLAVTQGQMVRTYRHLCRDIFY